MPIVADGAVRVAADMDPFNRELKSGLGRAEQQAQTFGQKLNAALSPKNLAAGLGIGFSIAQVTQFLGDAIGAASDLGETVSKTSQVIGEDALPALEEWAEGAAEAFGQSKRTALDAASSFAIFGKSAGLAGDDLVGFSTGLTELSADFASFFNTSPEEAIQAIGAALRGESEPIRRYGILLDDATLRQRAFTMGITESIRDALTPQQRVLAAQAEIMAQSADAQGDFARTSDGLANQQRILQARLENVSVEIGEKLLPIMVTFVSFISDTGIPILREFIELLDFSNAGSAEGIPGLEQVEDALNGISDSSLVLNDMLWGREQKIRDAAEAIGTDYMNMRVRIGRVMDEFTVDHDRAIDIIVNGLDAIPETISATVLASTAAWKERDIGQAAREAAEGIPEAFETARDEAVEVARYTPGAIGDALREGLDDYQDDLDALVEMAANSVSDLAERQEIEGILASQGLTDALSSDSSRTRDEAVAFVNDLISDYELLAPGAYDAGQLVDPSLANGIAANVGLSEDVAQDLANRTGAPLEGLASQSYGWGALLSANFMAGMSSYHRAIVDTSISLGAAAASGLRLRSPAEAGPLSEPADKWGLTLGVMFAKGMRDSIPGIRGSSLAMAGAAVLNPGMGSVASLTGGATATMGGGGPTFILQVEGQKPIVGTRDDVLERWQQMTSFTKDGVQS